MNSILNYVKNKGWSDKRLKKLEVKLTPVITDFITRNYGKELILDRFNSHIKGKIYETENSNIKHCGKEGHWLEKQMNLDHNNRNEPDLYGYEMKKESPKITFGDFSASEYLFSKKKPEINIINNWNSESISRKEFMMIFGMANKLKDNRYSWSGKCVPKYNIWNHCGQILTINERNDIIIYYSYTIDKREYKVSFPDFLKKDNIVIALWKQEKLSQNINNKFNKKGFFICRKENQMYNKISFGKPFTFRDFINGIKNNKIIFDSGMVDGNNRNYSQFRSNGNSFWDMLVTDEY